MQQETIMVQYVNPQSQVVNIPGAGPMQKYFLQTADGRNMACFSPRILELAGQQVTGMVKFIPKYNEYIFKLPPKDRPPQQVGSGSSWGESPERSNDRSRNTAIIFASEIASCVLPKLKITRENYPNLMDEICGKAYDWALSELTKNGSVTQQQVITQPEPVGPAGAPYSQPPQINPSQGRAPAGPPVQPQPPYPNTPEPGVRVDTPAQAEGWGKANEQPAQPPDSPIEEGTDKEPWEDQF